MPVGEVGEYITSGCAQIDPLHDDRWPQFLLRHPEASIFHTRGWLEALHRTYGYLPFVLTTSRPGQELVDGTPVCRINSRLTGSRLVSLPFSDHCEPLVSGPADSDSLVTALRGEWGREHLKYIELRPATSALSYPGFRPARQYWLHRIDIHPSLEALFRSFHKDCVQRKIRRAEREALRCEEGRSEAHLKVFHRLFLQTRRRHGLPPPPPAWLRNLLTCLGDSAQIHLAFKDAAPVAGILTLRYKHTLVYKYGCADTRYNALGGLQLLLWRAIQEGKGAGLLEVDLGRSDMHDDGLVAFKDRWGSSRSLMTYWRYPTGLANTGAGAMPGYTKRFMQQTIAHLPDSVLTLAGRLLYRHAG